MTCAHHVLDKLRGKAKRTLAARDKRFRRAAFELLEPRHLLSGTGSIEPAVADGPAPVAMPLTAVAYPASNNPQVAAPTFVTLDRAGTATPDTSSSPVGFTALQILSAYNINQVKVGGQQATGAGQTIAIIDAYNDPDIAADLQTFDTAMGLPAAPSFTVVSQTGSTVNLPVDDTSNWAVEESLDVEWAHTIAPGANIILVEANTNNNVDIDAAVAYAKTLPAVSVISMSYGSPEYAGENNSLYTTPAGHIGITFVASTGDNGAPGEDPAASPNVVAAGGTSLYLTGSNTYSSEVGWSGSGGGISPFESQPNYQLGVVSQSSTQRTTPDVSFDADPDTGPAIIDSYTYGSADPWTQIGGTSFAAPSWAAMIALADQIRVASGQGTLDGPSQTLPELYQLPAADFHDVTSGNNGISAAPGYDLVTGIGTPIANLVLPALAAGFPNTPAGLSATSSAVPSVAAGDYLTYTIRVFNNSATDAHSVSLTDLLPSGETLISQSQTFGPSFTLASTGNNVSDTLATLPAGEFAAFTITATLSSSLASGTQLVNSATASATGSSAEIATSTTGVITQSALAVTNSAPLTVNAGQDLSYAIILANNGPSDAAAVSLSDLLPSGETLISQTQTSGPAFTLAASGNQVNDTLATLPSGSAAAFTIVVAVSGNLIGNSLLTDTAAASDGQGDQGTGPATSTVETVATGGLVNTLHVFSNPSDSVSAGLVLVGSKFYGVTSTGSGLYGDGTIFSVNSDGTGYQLLHSFAGADGSKPAASLTFVGSKLYGTTENGGLDGDGTVFSINTDGSDFQSLHSFSGDDGTLPVASLTAIGSTLFGTTQAGDNGDGSIFSISTDGTGFQSLYDFSGTDGSAPLAGLTVDGSTLLGTTSGGGASSGGTVFSVDTDGSDFQTLYSFSYLDGSFPAAGLTLAGATIYGTTEFGGSGAEGTVFSIGVNGSGFQSLHSFAGPDGSAVTATLTLVGSTLYGTTVEGGAGDGTVFAINIGGSGFQTLHAFAGPDGRFPTAGFVLAGSTLYSTTGSGGSHSEGSIFSINTGGTGFQTLDSLSGTGDGKEPAGSLTLAGSTLYGMTSSGGLYGDGAIFSTNSDGSDYQVLYSFSGADGSGPDASLTVIGTTLYGTTRLGGNDNDGTIFSINTDGSDFQTLHSFSGGDGDQPEAGLTVVGSTLYGTTTLGGVSSMGTIFSISANGAGFQTLQSFSGSDGDSPAAALTLVGSILFGTTELGGINSDGTVFEINTGGTGFQTLHSFSYSDGYEPEAGLTLAGSTLYGTTAYGGSGGAGTIFSITTGGLGFQTLYAFSGVDGDAPGGSLTLAGSKLYGTTQFGGNNSDGTIFSIKTDGTDLTTLYTFSTSDEGYDPQPGLILGGSTLYGTTELGAAGNSGTIFSMPLLEPTVVGAFVSGSAWSASYLSMLSTAGLGNSAVGFELVSGADQLTTIPWTNVTQISIAFSEFVNVSQGSLTLYNSANTIVPASGYSYNSTTNIATWQFSTALVANKYVINLAASSVSDANGVKLDGAWTTGVSTFAARSGDGTPGGDFNFYFDVLPGDANASGTVTNGDVLDTKLQVGAVSNANNYQLDVNGAPNITNSDVLLEKLQVGSNINNFSTPSLPAQSAAATLPDDVLTPDALTADVPTADAPAAPSPAPDMQPATTDASSSMTVSPVSSMPAGLTFTPVSPLNSAISTVVVPAIPLTLSAAPSPVAAPAAASPVADGLFQALADSTAPATPALTPNDVLALVLGSLDLNSSRVAFMPADDVADDAAPTAQPAFVAAGSSSAPSPLALDEVFARNSGALVQEADFPPAKEKPVSEAAALQRRAS
ncbi:MAG TPA: choice-of-anchor tandem repeat GloVer-containing protein [Pirellulales bacterium]|nr:choice-of-anchor tandem repeat GloVer-containing protein [Pirellulales bacterium]